MITAATFARDLPSNPAICQISLHAAPAVFVVRALEVSHNGDLIHRHGWLVCEDRTCIDDAMIHADAISPKSIPAVMWPATVQDLEDLSGLAVIETAVA